jgi:Ca-activated chloride channel family protein
VAEKITETRHIRQQLERFNKQQNRLRVIPRPQQRKYRGLGLNWRGVVILIMVLLYAGLYQVQAQAADYFDLDDIDTGMMLAFHRQGNDYAALTLLSSQYDVEITGIVAEVKISQTFINQTSAWIHEGMYAFPVAENAAVYGMKLVIGQRVIEGEIHEKAQAQQIYNEAKEQGLSASLVKQYRPNLFTTDVANIMPNEKVVVEIVYQQTLRYDAGHIDFRLPLAIKSRYMQEKFLPDFATDTNLEAAALGRNSINDGHNRNINIDLEAGFELSELKSLHHNVLIDDREHQQHISLEDTRLYDSQDFVLRWQPQRGLEPQAALFSERLNGEEYVLMMLLPPSLAANNGENAGQKREVVFIIDTSGSMHGEAMDAAKDALLFALTQLQGEDKFNVIELNSFARELFKSSVLADAANLERAMDFIEALSADGGTNMAPALAAAMAAEVDVDYLKQIIFVTDGSVGNEAQIFAQISQSIGVARLFTVAIGAAPNNYFMKKAATVGRGTYTNIADLNAVDANMHEQFVKLSTPALTDIMIQWQGFVQQNPRIIPDLYTDQPIVVTARMKTLEPDVAISGFANKNTWSRGFELHKDGHSPGIARLWARDRIEDLTDDLMLGADINADIDADVLQQQITDIALKFHLVSAFTSLVAVDRTPERSRLFALQALALSAAEQVAFAQTALGWKWQLLLGLLLLAVAGSYRLLVKW